MFVGEILCIVETNKKLNDALLVISNFLHLTFNSMEWMKAHDHSKQSCILSSLATRDFLFRIGFRDVEVLPVVTFIRATENGELLHSLGIGDPDLSAEAQYKRWSGHMVVNLPSYNAILDTTLYQAQRPQWSNLPGMILAPHNGAGKEMFGLKLITSIRNEENGVNVEGYWLSQPQNKKWKSAPDNLKNRRNEVVEKMISEFNKLS